MGEKAKERRRQRLEGGGRGGGIRILAYASAGKDADTTGWFRNALHACINTSLSNPLT